MHRFAAASVFNRGHDSVCDVRVWLHDRLLAIKGVQLHAKAGMASVEREAK
jgi:hypothetical protein